MSTRDAVTNYLQWARRPRSAVVLHLLAVVAMFGLWQVAQGAVMITVTNRFGKDSVAADALMPLTFIAPTVVLLVLVRILFGPPTWRVALPQRPWRWTDYPIALALGWAAQLVTYLALSPVMDVAYRGWGAQQQLSLALLCALLLGLVVQTAFEEFYFRGIVMAATYRIVRWIPVVVGVQALFFAQLRVGNITAFGTGPVAMLPYLIPAVGFGYVAWRTGSLLMAMGLHLANNSFGVLGVGVKGDVLAGPAAWEAVPSLHGAILFAACYWAVVLLGFELLMHTRGPAS